MGRKENAILLVKAFDRISKILASIETYAGELSISKTEILALECVSRQEGLIMSMIAKELDLQYSSTTKIVDRLFERALVTRIRNGGDRRTVKVVLTDKGKEIVTAYKKQKMDVFRKMLAVLGPAEQENLILAFNKIADVWEAKGYEAK